MGLKLATPHQWRFVLLFSSALSLVQVILSPLAVESPIWLHRHGLLQEKAAAARKLWELEESPSLSDSHSQSTCIVHFVQLTIWLSALRR